MSIEWQLIASGFLDVLVADMVSVTSKDARLLLRTDGAFIGKLQRSCYDSLAWVPPVANVRALERHIGDPHTNPHIDVAIPMVSGAVVEDDQITCDDPGDGYDTDVYSWDYVEFTDMGPLSEISSFDSGIYVLVNRRESDDQLGLPSLFLEV